MSSDKVTGAVEEADRFEVHEASIASMQEAMADGRTTAEAVVGASLARIASFDQQGPALNAIVRTDPTAAAQAQERDRERVATGPRGPLHGIPILIKDNIDVAGMPTAAGTLALASWMRHRDATVVERLRKAGAVILGKTAMHELAAGITGVSSLSGATRNPYALDRVSGGSSGGSAAAVAASFAPVALGSDTAGSVRIPAAFQNLYGLRVTHGLIDMEGVVPLSPSQDALGLLARGPDDLAAALAACLDASGEACDGVAPGEDRLEGARLEGVRLGVLPSLFGSGPDEEATTDICKRSLSQMVARGASVEDIEFSDLERALEQSNVIAHEFKFALADHLSKDTGAPISSLGEILGLGLHHAELDAVLTARDRPRSRDTEAYRDALQARAALRRRILRLFDDAALDAICYPAIRRAPARVGEAQSGPNGQLAAATGLPALVVPAGLTSEGLPVGLEFLGRPFSEGRLLQLARAFARFAPAREAPWTTPPLWQRQRWLTADVRIPGAAPPADATLSLGFDADTSRLHWRLVGLDGDVLIAVGLGHRQGPIAQPLHATSERQSGAVRLAEGPRRSLLRGDLEARLFTASRPQGLGSVAVRLAPSEHGWIGT